MAEILEPGRGKVEIADVFAAYADFWAEGVSISTDSAILG